MLTAFVTISFFVVVLLISFVTVLIVSEIQDRRARQEGAAVAATVGADGPSALLREERVSSISPIADLLERYDFVHIIHRQTMEAGLDWPVGRTVAMMLLCGTLAIAVCSASWMPGTVLIAIGVFGSLLPYMYILRKRRKRFEQFENQFPEALDSLCRALKAGHPLAAGMEVVASEPYPPVSAEVRKTLEEWRLGMTWPQALDALCERVPVTDVQVFAAAVKLHMRTGGRLGEVLTKLAESMRENSAIRGEVRAMAAHGRMTGNILSFLPIAIAAMTFYVNPHQMEVLVTHPIGRNLIVAAIICLILAHFVIRRIVNIRLQ